MLRAENIEVRLGRTRALNGVSLTVAPGEVVAVLGPNGSGKSTLMRVMSGELTPRQGQVLQDDRPLGAWPRRALAAHRAVLPQSTAISFPFRALQVVLLGRSPHAGTSSHADDLEIATQAMRETEVTHLADRVYPSLSGGEQQRVQMARVLAQIWPAGASESNRFLLLDEPTSSLDIAHQHSALATARRFAARGMGVVVILHDLNLAAIYADRLCVLEAGCLVHDGPPEQVLTPDVVKSVFDLSVTQTRHPTRGWLQLLPDGRPTA